MRAALDNVLRAPRLHRLYGPLLAAPAVREAARLVWREWSHSEEPGVYTLRGSGLRACLRHPYLDMWMLDEIFRRRVYAMPPEVRSLLAARRGPLHVVDIGACAGLASLYFAAAFPDARVVAFEPDEGNAAVLERTIAVNALQERWSVVRACAGVRDGTVPFVSDHFLSRVDPQRASPRARDVPEVDVFPYLAGADLVKIDVQGSEWQILRDPRFATAGVAALVVEYHPWLAPGDDAHGAARTLLREAGYTVGAVRDAHAGEGTVWAWRAYPESLAS